MIWNYNPDNVVFIDFETQSGVNLRSIGGKLYLSHPSTRVMCMTVLDGNTAHLWIPHSVCRYPIDESIIPDAYPELSIETYTEDTLPEPIAELVRTNTVVASNAEGFDAIAWEKLVDTDIVPQWFDAIHLYRYHGYSGKLDSVSKSVLGIGKDESGSDALQILCNAVVRKGNITYPVGTPYVWMEMLRYNILDTCLLRDVFTKLYELGTESDVMQVNATINSRGIACDMGLARKLSAIWDELREDAYNSIGELTDGQVTNIRSQPQMMKWLHSKGCNIDTLSRKELEQLYLDPDEFFDEQRDDYADIIHVLKLRQLATRTVVGKLDRLYDLADSDGRVRDLIVYHKALTGRFAGRGLQPHNLPRPTKGVDVEKLLSGSIDTATIREYAKATSIQIDDILSTLFRPIFVAQSTNSLCIADYAAIEARGVAWVANETILLDKFARGVDLYIELARTLFATETVSTSQRFIAKQIILGCGYGMSAKKFDFMCRQYHIDLPSVGVTAEQCVNLYRRSYPRVPSVWREVGIAAMNTIKMVGSTHYAGRCSFTCVDGTLHITLPSGRVIKYHHAHIEKRIPGWARVKGETKTVDTIIYTHPQGYTKSIYGALIVENIVQAICRDLLCTALVNCEAHGLPVVCHVHDEIVVESSSPTSDLIDLLTIMSTPPEWARGFPITVEGHIGKRYMKEGSNTAKATNGIIR